MNGQADAALDLPVANLHLWSPENPHLYGLEVSLVRNGRVIDHVGSYFALRKVSPGQDPPLPQQPLPPANRAAGTGLLA